MLGRDMFVRVEAKGVLFPWGHRAVLVDLTRRDLTPDTGPATAGLLQRRLLIVPDPVRGRADDGELARALPFDEIEVLQPTVELGADEVIEQARRSPKRLAELDQELIDRRNALATQEQVVADLFVQCRVGIDDNAIFLSGPANERLAVIWPIITELEDIDRAFQEWAATQPPDPPPPPPEFIPADDIGGGELGGGTDLVPVSDPGLPMLTPGQAAQLNELSNEATVLVAQLSQIESDRVAAQARLVDEESLRGFGGQFGEGVDLVRRLAPSCRRSSSSSPQCTPRPIRSSMSLWPYATTGERLRVPLRCDGLHVTSPVLFVHDLHVDANDDFDELWPLGDYAVRQRIAAAWDSNQDRRLPVGGVPVDLVRSGPIPQPADVLAVHELTVSGRHDGSGFRAVVDEARVALAAVRELVPGASELTRVAYTPDFLRDGLADHVALRLPDGIPVNFTQAADKAGGLISPVFKADVLSRLDGPVDGRALPGFLAGPPDLAAAFDGATILGMPLAALVDDRPAQTAGDRGHPRRRGLDDVEGPAVAVVRAVRRPPGHDVRADRGALAGGDGDPLHDHRLHLGAAARPRRPRADPLPDAAVRTAAWPFARPRRRGARPGAGG